jgi:hypothetical protein
LDNTLIHLFLRKTFQKCSSSAGRSMVWYGMVWYGMVWYGMVWYGMVWYGIFEAYLGTLLTSNGCRGKADEA